MASVGFCVVSTTKRGYPLEDATHIAFSKTLTHKLTQLSLRKPHTHHFLSARHRHTQLVVKCTVITLYHVIYHTFFLVNTHTHSLTYSEIIFLETKSHKDTNL